MHAEKRAVGQGLGVRMPFPSISRVHLCGENKHDCGYCKGENKGLKDYSISYGVLSEVLTIEDYQAMMLVGWRRSGKYLYKPIMHRTCCPQYTIRLRVNDHKLSKSQKKTLKKIDQYLASRDDDDVSVTTEENLSMSKEFTLSSASVLPAEAVGTPRSPSKRGARQLTIEMDNATSTPEKYDLYRRYQIAVHKDAPEEVTEKGFKRFLVQSPLKDTGKSSRPAACLLPSTYGTADFKYGTYHMLYRLNGKLIAVGVVDLLPLGLSSVYVFYDNDYKELELGKYTALKEIEFCRQHGFEYYYMGYYIHTCEKMRYKGEYKPSDLLCPTTLEWYPLQTHCLPILEKYRFSPFDPMLAETRATIAVDVGNSSPALAATEKDGQDQAQDHHSTPEKAAGTAATEEPRTAADPLQQLERFRPMVFLYSQAEPTAPGAIPGRRLTPSQALAKVPLDIGQPEPFFLKDLQPHSRKSLEPIVEEYLSFVGPEIGTTVALSFV